MKTRYYVLFPEAENVHLIKDVGMIAYKMFKLFDYEAFVACYENGTYNYLDNEVEGLKLNFIEKKYNNQILDGIRFLRKNSKDIDVLQLFHITLRSVFYAFAYKFFNSKGKIFLKLDCTERLVEIIKSLSGVKLKVLNMFLSKVDIIGVEQEKLYEELKNIIVLQKNNILHIPNGIDFQGLEQHGNIDNNKKENIILHVGRIGSPEKATDVFLEAIAKIDNFEDRGWKVKIIGPIENSFKKYIDDFLNRNERLKPVLEFTGPINDRQKLFEDYKKAKIFCLSSHFESFGIALIEAASFGDVIVSTDVGIAKELVSKENGSIVSIGDYHALAANIDKYMINNELEILSRVTENICRNKFDWNNIVAMLHQRLIEISRG
jgi:L-malate glycosyltransferase